MVDYDLYLRLFRINRASTLMPEERYSQPLYQDLIDGGYIEQKVFEGVPSRFYQLRLTEKGLAALEEYETREYNLCFTFCATSLSE